MRRGYRVIFAILQRAGLRNGAILRKTSMYGGFMSPDFLLARDLPIMAAVQRFQEALLHWPWNVATGFVLAGVIVVFWSNKVWPFAFVLGGPCGNHNGERPSLNYRWSETRRRNGPDPKHYNTGRYSCIL